MGLRTLHNFNVYFIRSCFWSVLLIGTVDVTIAFMRVEEISNLIFDDEIVKALKNLICMYLYSYSFIMHFFFIGYITKTLGFTWLALMIVCAELIIVITRFVFSYEQSFMGDLVRYWYAGLFLLRLHILYTRMVMLGRCFLY